ncbi:MAG: transporter substrate-binding domain-containing protein [Burkholderiales bacterium]|nr:transporter substrate-binding domain-containing protein [Burkholderiales bacterium]
MSPTPRPCLLTRFLARAAISIAALATYASDLLPTCPHHPISFAYYEMGYAYSDAETVSRGTAKGIDKDLLDEMIKRTHCQFRTAVYARARTWHDLQSGDLDMASAAAETPERDRFAWFAFYMIGKQYLIVGPTAPTSVKGMDDLLADPKMKLGVVRSFVHGKYFDDYVARLRPLGRVLDYVDQDALYYALQKGEVNAVFGLSFVYPLYIDKFYLGKQVRVLDLDPTPGLKHGIVMSKSAFSEKDAEHWRAVVDGIRHDGTMQRIIARYLGEERARQMTGF